MRIRYLYTPQNDQHSKSSEHPSPHVCPALKWPSGGSVIPCTTCFAATHQLNPCGSNGVLLTRHQTDSRILQNVSMCNLRQSYAHAKESASCAEPASARGW